MTQVACENCIQKKKEDWDCIAEVSRIVLNEPLFVNSLYKVLKHLNEFAELERSMITIFNRKTGKISVKEACGVSPRDIEKGIYSPGEGITGRVVDTGEAIIVPDISQDSRFLNRTGFAGQDMKACSFISVPIKAGEEVIGTLSALLEKADDKDLEAKKTILYVVGTIIFYAVQRSQAREEEFQQLREENLMLHERLGDRQDTMFLLGNSGQMKQLHQIVDKVASSDVTVLILGESGVGKGLVAQTIHEKSDRSNKPFVKLNCAALSESIIESELFGHERGSFTGAVGQRIGRFEQADGGTIFLDEIGEVSINIQAKLLRVLQEKEFERLGGNQTLKSDVRIIAATNKNLEEKVKIGEFREDLYYRLNIIPIEVPPLRDRKSDITLLADHFVEKYSRQNGKEISRISTPAIDMLMAYHWPGNVRELENAIERAVILSEDDTIHGYNLPPSLQMPSGPKLESVREGTLQQKLDTIEYEMIVEAMKSTHGNLSRSAEILGLSNRMIGIRAKKYGIDFKLFRDATGQPIEVE